MNLPLSQIRTDGGTQPRAAIDFAAVEDYSDAMRDGVRFPPVVVFYDGTDYWLADGFHRLKAAFGAERDEIECDIHQGTQTDAQWYSFSANKDNGLRRSSEDVWRAIASALVHPKAKDLSQHQIAKHIGCSQQWVSQQKIKMVSNKQLLDSPTKTVTRGGTTYQQNTANIGRKSEPKPEPDYSGGTRVERQAPGPQPERMTPPRLSIAPPPKQEPPRADKEAEALKGLRAIFDLAELSISMADLVSTVPDHNIPQLHAAGRAAAERVLFLCDETAKRQKKSTEVA
jgi:hypothetical protein